MFYIYQSFLILSYLTVSNHSAFPNGFWFDSCWTILHFPMGYFDSSQTILHFPKGSYLTSVKLFCISHGVPIWFVLNHSAFCIFKKVLICFMSFCISLLIFIWLMLYHSALLNVFISTLQTILHFPLSSWALCLIN